MTQRLSKWPLYKTFTINHEGGQSYVTVAQATESETIQRESMFGDTTRWTPKLGRQEAYLVLSSICNMEMPLYDPSTGTTEMGEPFENGEGYCGTRIRYGMSRADFDEAWGSFGGGISLQIHDCVREMNPHWYNATILEHHLAQTKEAYYVWNQWKVENGDKRPSDLEILQQMGIVEPELPDAFVEMLRSKDFGFTKFPNPGGLLDQPQIYMLELSLCLSLLEERQHLQSVKVSANASDSKQGRLSTQ